LLWWRSSQDAALLQNQWSANIQDAPASVRVISSIAIFAKIKRIDNWSKKIDGEVPRNFLS